MPAMFRSIIFLVAIVALLLSHASLQAQEQKVIPHGQAAAPGPALSPAEAIAKMTVPEGFSVELVASEPDIVNPVAMTFDERGRVWITESLEYPRSSAGPGRDRIKVLEDTDGDGKADKFTIFAEGLNIPSGIAVGYGGVWVANAPDILFMQDTDGDGRADKQEVVVTGFGRADTHELPNSLTWGPDGWLYGLNGVFNPAKVVQGDKTFEFTCAMFRIHPRTREFQVFCEGTSNPWGIAFNNEGDAFVSACVIDHLWHLVETGYYHRQGGPYPPFTWKIESIVDHKHQKAAYCGIHWFDSDAYPPKYREKLYMGNIHGNCINVDRLERHGSTYKGHTEPDFLAANDAWFMPVVQKTGPDGCLYILDWYDRYHCYQDARRDPEGIDRLKGRLYRIRYKDTPRAPKFDLAKETDDQLIERLKNPNVFYRDIAQRLLAERANAGTIAKLEMLLNQTLPLKVHMHAVWAMIGSGRLDHAAFERLLAHRDSNLHSWAVRGAANQHMRLKVNETWPSVVVQSIIAAGKHDDTTALLQFRPSDRHAEQVLWANLSRLTVSNPGKVARLATSLDDWVFSPEFSVRLINQLIDLGEPGQEALKTIGESNTITKKSGFGLIVMQKLLGSVQAGELSAERFGERWKWIAEKQWFVESPERIPLLASLGDPGAIKNMRKSLEEETAWGSDVRGIVKSPYPIGGDRGRNTLLLPAQALISGGDASDLPRIIHIVTSTYFVSQETRREILGSLNRSKLIEVGKAVCDTYSKLDAPLQPVAIELLTQRDTWSRELLAAIDAKRIAADVLNVNQIRKLQTSKDPELVKRAKAIWGTVRTERNPAREQVVAAMGRTLAQGKGDPHAGVAVFNKVCGQCHKIYGQGQEVGPDITLNGRGSFEQLLSNVFDPSLVIGSAYQARTVQTADGRILTGLVVEDSPQRVVLKVQGGKLETIARGDVEEMETSKLSLMPEGVEKQLQPQELLDLFAFLRLDKPPTDPTARLIPDSKK